MNNEFSKPHLSITWLEDDSNIENKLKNIVKAKDFGHPLKEGKDRYTDPETGAHFKFDDICTRLHKLAKERFFSNKK